MPTNKFDNVVCAYYILKCDILNCCTGNIFFKANKPFQFAYCTPG